jgi:hypothetical protein
MPLISSLGVMNAINFTFPLLSKKQDFLVVGYNSSPYIAAYKSSNSDVSTRYSNPSTVTVGGPQAVDVNTTNQSIAIGYAGDPTLAAYGFSSDLGFGSKYSGTSGITGNNYNVRKLKFTPSGVTLIATTSNGAGPYFWHWTDTSGFGTRYSNTTVQTNTIGLEISPSGTTVFTGVASLAYLNAFRWTDASGVGTLYTAPPTSDFNGPFISFSNSPNGSALALAYNGTLPTVGAYRFTEGTGFGTKYTAPSVNPYAAATVDVCFSSNGTALFCTGGATPFGIAYAWSDSTGFGTKYTNPSSIVAGNGTGVDTNKMGTLVGFSHEVSPFLSVYPWSDSTGFGAIRSITSPLTSAGSCICFSK